MLVVQKNAIESRQRIVNLSKVFDRDTFENVMDNRIRLVDATPIDMDSEEGQVKFSR